MDKTKEKILNIVQQNPQGINIIKVLQKVAEDNGENEFNAHITARKVCKQLGFEYTDKIYPTNDA